MKDLDFYKDLIIQHLEDFFQKEILPRNPNLYQPAKYALEGGKKLRPAIAMKTAESFASDPIKALYPALALEVFHNFTLVHDDIMDNSPLRRGKPTVFTKWTLNQALLSGDAMLILAYKLLNQTDKKYFDQIFSLFNETALQVCEGQQLDMDFEDTFNISSDDYLKMITLKTAVLIATSFKFGAIVSDAPEADKQNIYNFGLNLGLAFQIQDDFLDLYGDEQIFGKKIGNDIITNKKTFLLITALEVADNKTAEKLKNLFQDSSLSAQQKISSVAQIYQQLDVKNIVKQKILDFYQKAMKFLELVSFDDENKNFWKNFAQYIIKREY